MCSLVKVPMKQSEGDNDNDLKLVTLRPKSLKKGLTVSLA